MRKSVIKLFVIICCVLNLFACKNEEIDSEFVVYAAGHEIPTDNNYIVKYWKNGVGVKLNDSTTNGWASSIFVSENDVYVAGVEDGYGKRITAKYWKNGVGVNLSDGKYTSGAHCIYVVDSTIYVVGYDVFDNQKIGMLWVNGEKEYITSAGKLGNVNCVFVSNNKTYLGGSETTYTNGDILKYWIDDKAYNLNNEVFARGEIYSIYVNNGNVYMAGSMLLNNDEQYSYWINEKPYALKNGEVSGCSNSIFVLNDDFYIAGNQYLENGNHIAKYWKNGNEVNLTTGSKNAVANSIFVIGNNVFVGGAINDEPCYWRNGKLIKLNNGVKGAVSSIFVTQQ